MQTIKLNQLNAPSKILCSVFGHRFVQTRKVTSHFSEYKCTCCGLEMTNDVQGHKISLTPELKNINEILNGLYTKKWNMIGQH